MQDVRSANNMNNATQPQHFTLAGCHGGGGRCPAHRAASPAQQPLHRRRPRANRATQCYQEIAERTRKVPLPGPASAELAPLTCYGGLGLQHARPDSLAQHQPARQTVAASSCYVAVGRCGYVPPEELRLRLTHHKRDSDKCHAVRAMLNNLLKLLPHLRACTTACWQGRRRAQRTTGWPSTPPTSCSTGARQGRPCRPSKSGGAAAGHPAKPRSDLRQLPGAHPPQPRPPGLLPPHAHLYVGASRATSSELLEA